MRIHRASILLSLLLVALLRRDASAETYHVVDIGLPEGFTDGAASGINDAGMVVGTLLGATSRAFSYTEGGGVVLLDLPLGGTASSASAINAAGAIVGGAVSVLARQGAVRWSSPTTPVGLGESPGIGQSISAAAINSTGDAVGALTTNSFPPFSGALLWPADGGVTDLSALIGSGGGARDINDAGQVIVTSSSLLAGHAYLWSEASGSTELVGLLDATRTSASAISETGVAVGSSGTDFSGQHATRWLVSTGAEDLGVLLEGGNSVANAIDAGGTVVVGRADTEAGQHAMVWSEAGGMQDLDALSDAAEVGMTLTSAVAINASGQIAGVGDVVGHQHGFLATPVPELAATWPALVALCWLRRRRA